MPVTEDDTRAAVAAERTELAAVLAGLDPDGWDSPTLCEGWRVREVVAHMTMPFRISPARFLLDMARSGGRFNHMADRAARRDAARMSAAELLAALRDNVTHPWTPPGGGPAGALSHDVIHGLDCTVGLGLDRRVPPERLALVLQGLRPKTIAYFGVDLQGLRLEATDQDFAHGSGPGEPLRGSAQDLLLVICGRRLPPGRLSGPAAARFTRR